MYAPSAGAELWWVVCPVRRRLAPVACPEFDSYVRSRADNHASWAINCSPHLATPTGDRPENQLHEIGVVSAFRRQFYVLSAFTGFSVWRKICLHPTSSHLSVPPCGFPSTKSALIAKSPRRPISPDSVRPQWWISNGTVFLRNEKP